jgi:esterase
LSIDVNPARLDPEPQLAFVETSDGLKLSVRIWGSGPGVLLLHGFRDASFVWRAVAPALSGTFTLIAPELRGHGDSDWDPAARYELPAYLSDIETLVDKLQAPELTVVGHSLGARIGLGLAARRPDVVRRLALVDMSHLPPVSAVERMGPPPSAEGYASRLAYMAELEASRPLLSPEMRRLIAENALRPETSGRCVFKFDPAVTATHVAQSAERMTDLADAGVVRCPTLVLRGAWSALLSAAASEDLASRFADARLATIPRAGHAVMMDNPEGFVAALADFLR